MVIGQAAGVERGAMKPGHEVTGYLTRKHIYEIAKIKSQVGKMAEKDLTLVRIDRNTRNLPANCYGYPIGYRYDT